MSLEVRVSCEVTIFHLKWCLYVLIATPFIIDQCVGWLNQFGHQHCYRNHIHDFLHSLDKHRHSSQRVLWNTYVVIWRCECYILTFSLSSLGMERGCCVPVMGFSSYIYFVSFLFGFFSFSFKQHLKKCIESYFFESVA